MATSVSNVFVRQYESDVHHAFQRRAAKLRGAVRVKTGVEGESTDFPKLGTGAAVSKSRHGTIPTMNANHTSVTCTLTDHFAADYVDKFDELKMTIDDKRVLAETGAFALGRKLDSLLITAMDATTTTETGATGFTLDKVQTNFATLGNNDVFEDGRMWAIVPFAEWNELMTIQQFASADYVRDLPFAGGHTAKFWMGTTWMPHSGLETLVAAGVAKSFWFHQDAIGLAVGADVQASIDWIGERHSFFVNNAMSMGACMIDVRGCIEIQTTR